MIKPLNGNVILKKEIKENKTASGIVLSQKKEEEEFAHIVALSNDEEVKKLSLKVGDKVLFKNYSTTKVNYEDEEYQHYYISRCDVDGQWIECPAATGGCRYVAEQSGEPRGCA